jgi:hypothetical protein
MPRSRNQRESVKPAMKAGTTGASLASTAAAAR